MPFTRLRAWLEGVGVAAEVVEALGRRVAGAVRLTAGLDPHEGVAELGAGVSSGADAEARAVDVAPV